MNGEVLVGTAEQQDSPSDRLSKRARVEDGTEANTNGRMARVEQYHLLPPELAANPTENMPVMGNQVLPHPSPFSGVLKPFPAPTRPIYELEAIPASLPTPPTIEIPA